MCFLYRRYCRYILCEFSENINGNETANNIYIFRLCEVGEFPRGMLIVVLFNQNKIFVTLNLYIVHDDSCKLFTFLLCIQSKRLRCLISQGTEANGIV